LVQKKELRIGAVKLSALPSANGHRQAVGYPMRTGQNVPQNRTDALLFLQEVYSQDSG